MQIRINDKIKELTRYLEEYSSLKPHSAKEFKGSLENKAVGERYFEKIVECATDLAFLVINQNKLQEPTDDLSTFEILLAAGAVSKKTCEMLKQAKSMRNLIVHNYGEVKGEIVFNALDEELPRDIGNFISEIENYIGKNKK